MEIGYTLMWEQRGPRDLVDDARRKVSSELPGPAAFAAASSHVRPEDVAKSIPSCDWAEHDLLPALAAV